MNEQPDDREDGEMTDADIAADIARFEQQHGMTSAEFIERWKVNDVPDTFETNLWALLLKYGQGADVDTIERLPTIHKPKETLEVFLEYYETGRGKITPRHLHEVDADDRAALLAENKRLAERCEQLEAERETWLRRMEIIKGLDDWSLAYLARVSPAAAMVIQQVRDTLLDEDGHG